MTSNPIDAHVTSRERILRSLKLAIGILISVALLYATLSTASVERIQSTLARVQGEWIALALVFIALDYAAKVARWQAMLIAVGARVSFQDAAIPFLGCVALNNVLPFRAGDIVRVVAFRNVTQVSAPARLSTLLLERILDVVVLVSVLLASASLWIDFLPAMLVRGGLIATGAVIAAVLIFLLTPGAFARISRRLEARWAALSPFMHALGDLSRAMSLLSMPRLLARLVGLSIIAWLLEAAVFYAVGNALELALRPEIALVAMAIGTLSTVIPSSPGYVGTFHYFTALSVTAFGIGWDESTAYAVVVHGLLWGSTTAVGFLLLSVTGVGSALRVLRQP